MMRLASVLLASFMLLSQATAAQTIEEKSFDDSKVTYGTVGARYIPVPEKRIKTRVQLETDKYDYDLFGRESFVFSAAIRKRPV